MEFECAFTALEIEVSKADLRRFILLTDANKDGRVDFKEFHNVLEMTDNMDESDMEEAGVFIQEVEADLEASFEEIE